MKKILLAVSLTIASITLLAQEKTSAIPQWLIEEWKNQTQGSGIWIADNSDYMSDNEPYDAYGLQWQYGLGEKSVTGRLFVIKDGNDLGTVWEFRVFWDPGEKKAVIQQFGSDGTFGQGLISSPAQGKYRTEEVITSPSGVSNSTGHKKEYINKTTSKASSFKIDEDGNWTKSRTYVWKLKEV